MSSKNRAGFGTTPGEIGSQDLDAFAFADTGDRDIRSIDGLPFFVLVNTDTSAHVVNLKTRGTSRGKQITIPVSVAAGTAWPVPVTAFVSAADTNANGDLYGFLSDVPISGPRAAGGSGTGATVTYDVESVISPNANTTYQMGGLGAHLTLTPKASGNVLLIVTLVIGANAPGDIVQARAAWGTGSAPVLNAAATGSTMAGIVHAYIELSDVNLTAQSHGQAVVVVIPGLVVGTTYWFDIQSYITATANDSVFYQCGSVSELGT